MFLNEDLDIDIIIITFYKYVYFTDQKKLKTDSL